MVRVRERPATCRACLRSAGSSAVPLTLTLLHSYGQLLNADVSKGDGLPQHMCAKCSKLMMKLVRFREMCLSSEAMLMGRCSNSKVEEDFLKNEIKLEPETETEDTVNLILERVNESVHMTVEAEIHKESDADENDYDGSPWRDLDAVSGEPSASEHLEDSAAGAGRYPCGLCLNSYSSKKLVSSHLRTHEGERSCGACGESCAGWPQLLAHRADHIPRTKEHHCYICSRTFKDGAYLEAHLTFYHFGGTEASCKYCQKSYKSYRKMTKHILYMHRVMHDSRMLKCDQCPLKFQTRWQLNEHGKSTHVSYICDICGNKYSALSSLKNHMKRHAQQTNNIGCGLCKESPEKHELKQHLESHRNDTRCQICEESFADWPRLIAHRHAHVASAARSRTYYECYICLRKLRSVDSLELHLRGEHYSGLECKLCSKKLLNARKLSKHMNYHRNLDRFRCSICKNCFSSKSNLLSHMLVHSEEKKFVCNICDFRTHFQQALRNHVKRLHESGSFHCDSCHKIFTNNPALQDHRRLMHRPCPTVLCPHCGIHCKNKIYLKSHIRSHKNVMYKCDMCPSTFKTKGNLLYHINRHNGIRAFQCPHCPATFISPSVLIKHKRIHTGERPYVCKICKKGFMAGHNLKVHMKVHGLDLVVKRTEQLQSTFH